MAAPFSEMCRLARHNFSMVPLGGGEDGKAPLVRFKDKPIKLPQVQAIMSAKGSSMFGLRLDKLAVVDVDQQSPELNSIVTARCGMSAVQHDTPRGRHFFYSNLDAIRVKFDDLPIDFKTGFNSYVAGPHSLRPDGGAYEPVLGRLGVTPLTVIMSQPEAAYTPSTRVTSATGPVMEGGRHHHLLMSGKEMALTVESEDELLHNLLWERDEICEDGVHPYADAQVVGLAKYWWKKRLDGEIWGGTKMLAYKATVLDLVQVKAGGTEAFALYNILLNAHGNQRQFSLNFQGMKDAGLITFGRPAFSDAVNLLLGQGHMKRTANYSVGNRSNQYRLIVG